MHQETVTRSLIPNDAGLMLAGRGIAEVMAEIDAAEAEGSDVGPVFVTLPVAARLRRRGGRITRGLFFPVEALPYSQYASRTPADLLLNRDFVMAPWGRLHDVMPRVSAMFGTSRLFLRPESPMKPFTGFAGELDWLLEEVHLIGKAERVDPAEITIIAPAQQLTETEYRVWIVGSEVVTSAPYGWTESHRGAETPQSVIEVARSMAAAMEYVEDTFVADVGVVGGDARLVELNAVSTAGFYAGMDVERLVNALLNRME